MPGWGLWRCSRPLCPAIDFHTSTPLPVNPARPPDPTREPVVVRHPKLAHTTASRRRLEVTATVMSSRAPAVDADVRTARPSEDTRLFRAARAFFDTACLVCSRREATRAGGLRQPASCWPTRQDEEGP